MPEQKVSTEEWATVIDGYLQLLTDAKKIQVENKDGSRADLDDPLRDAMLRTLKEAKGALVDGCQQGVYGLFLME